MTSRKNSMASYFRNRRQQRRHKLPRVLDGKIEFDYKYLPEKVVLKLHDMSASGVSFVLDPELPELDAGDRINRVTMTCGDYELHGDLLVMHISQREQGDVCGAIFFPSTDEHILGMQALLASLEQEELAVN